MLGLGPWLGLGLGVVAGLWRRVDRVVAKARARASARSRANGRALVCGKGSGLGEGQDMDFG